MITLPCIIINYIVMKKLLDKGTGVSSALRVDIPILRPADDQG